MAPRRPETRDPLNPKEWERGRWAPHRRINWETQPQRDRLQERGRDMCESLAQQACMLYHLLPELLHNRSDEEMAEVLAHAEDLKKGIVGILSGLLRIDAVPEQEIDHEALMAYAHRVWGGRRPRPDPYIWVTAQGEFYAADRPTTRTDRRAAARTVYLAMLDDSP